MAKQAVKKKPAKDNQQIARSVLDAVVSDAEPAKKKTTPAAAAGIVARKWKIEDLVELADVPQFAGK